MQKTKLLSLLKNFSARENQQFLAWVKAEVGQGRKGNFKLLTYLLRFAPDYDSPDLEKNRLWKVLYPQKNFSSTKLKTDTKALFDLAKSFLAFQELEARPQEMALLSLAAIQKKKIPRLLQTESDALSRQLEAMAQEDDQLRYTRFRLAEIANQNFGLAQRRVVDNSLQEMLDNLDRWYLVQKLRGACELLNRQNIFGSEARLPLVPSLMEGLEQEEENFTDTPALTAYRLVFEMLSHPSDDNTSDDNTYHRLRDFLEANWQLFPAEEARALYKYAQNHCIARANQGNTRFLNELFALSQHLLKTALILRSGIISHSDYTNITAVAMRLEERAWADGFMEKYRQNLAPEFRESVYTYNRAMYHHQGKAYGACIRLLNQTDFAGTFYDLSARMLLSKVYYESGEYEALGYQMEAFKRYLTRKKDLSPQNRIPYLRFLRMLKKLVHLKESGWVLKEIEQSKRLQKLSRQIQDEEVLAHREWLQTMVGQGMKP